MSKVPLNTSFELAMVVGTKYHFRDVHNSQIAKRSFLPINMCFYSLFITCLFVFFKYQESVNFFFVCVSVALKPKRRVRLFFQGLCQQLKSE